VICATCGYQGDDLGGGCSSEPTILLCQGHDPVSACGKPLTAEERHWYGTTCEACERRWGERIEKWRKGGPDTDIDAMLDSPVRNPRHAI